MDFEWDPEKARSNLAKHGVRFDEAKAVFIDPAAITLSENHPEEQRFVALGMDRVGRVLVVAYMWRADRIRMISARKATPRERRVYEEGI